ncbi:AmmeMemoRadiSam system radical SAM enzyme [Candidatus Woesearchaeota archaeon]|nr:AmmeMemoRadiSam system radical SAM enzyme [Candidatus Woesearchaeota archaeon]
MQEAKFYKRLNDKSLQCTACNQYCVIKEGDTGICSVRQNVDGKLMLLAYGNAVGVAIDPIEKKPFYHFMPGKQSLSFGTLGCNFECLFCQNWDMSQQSKMIREQLQKEKRLHELDYEIGEFGYSMSPNMIVDECRIKKIPIIAYTYNEPTVFFEYAYDTIMRTKDKKTGIRNVFVSNGYESIEVIGKMKGKVDAINIDLKSFNDDFYRKVCHARLQPVLDTIKECHKLGIWIEITTLVIPGHNDSDEEFKDIAEFIASINTDIPWHISAFHPMYKMKDIPATRKESLERAYEIGKRAGLHNVYIGNVMDEKRSSTYCPKCGAIVIRRNGFSSEMVNFKDGRCSSCNEKIAGIWE